MKIMNWSDLTNSELLKLKWQDLGLTLENSSLRKHLRELHQDLKLKGFKFRPDFFISDGWYVSMNYTAIAIPFYLLHPRLIALETEIMGKAEGERTHALRRLLRHELGHAIDHAYKLRHFPHRDQIFGPSRLIYPNSYQPNKLSTKNFVQYLGENYGSSHPDEDWAETFAAWFDMRIHWRLRYPLGETRKKLNFINNVMSEIKGVDPLIKRSIKKADILNSNKTLGSIFRHRLKVENKFYNFEVEDLKSILVGKERQKNLIQANKETIGSYLSYNLSYPKRDVMQILKNLETSLWRQGYCINVNSNKSIKVLTKHFAHNIALYIGKEKNNILM